MAYKRNCLKSVGAVLSTAAFLVAAQTQLSYAAGYHLAEDKQMNIGSDIEFLSVNKSDGNLLAGYGNNLGVIDGKTLDIKNEIRMSGSGIAMAINDSAARGYISLSSADAIEVIDLKSHKSLSVIKTPGLKPGHSVYDQASESLFVADHEAANLVVLDLTKNSQVKIPVAGKIHTIVSNHRGYIFASIENKPIIEIIDVHLKKSLGEISLLSCEAATGLDIDIHERRLFIVCANGWMQILDTDTGYRLNRLQIGTGGGQVKLDYEPERIVNIFTLTKQNILNIGKVKKVTFSSEQALDYPQDNPLMQVDDVSGTVFVASGKQIRTVKK